MGLAFTSFLGLMIGFYPQRNAQDKKNQKKTLNVELKKPTKGLTGLNAAVAVADT